MLYLAVTRVTSWWRVECCALWRGTVPCGGVLYLVGRVLCLVVGGRAVPGGGALCLVGGALCHAVEVLCLAVGCYTLRWCAVPFSGGVLPCGEVFFTLW